MTESQTNHDKLRKEELVKWITHPARYASDFHAKGNVYALFNVCDEIIYVGQTIQLDTRLHHHFKTKPDACYCKYFEVPSSEMTEWESLLILKHLPIHNKVLPKNDTYWTIEGYQKMDIRFYSSRIHVLRLAEQFDTYRGYYHRNDLQKISQILDVEEAK